MHTIQPARLKPHAALPSGMDGAAATVVPTASSLIVGQALVFWDRKSPAPKKLDAIDTDQITPAADCVSESLDTLDERWKAGSFRYLMPDFRARVRSDLIGVDRVELLRCRTLAIPEHQGLPHDQRRGGRDDCRGSTVHAARECRMWFQTRRLNGVHCRISIVSNRTRVGGRHVARAGDDRQGRIPGKTRIGFRPLAEIEPRPAVIDNHPAELAGEAEPDALGFAAIPISLHPCDPWRQSATVARGLRVRWLPWHH